MVSCTFEQQSIGAGMIFSIAFSFILGLWVGKSLESCHQALSSSDKILNNRETLVDPELAPVSDKLSQLSSLKFACNTRIAFEHLSELHTKRTGLEEHRQRGDANRARIATIERKAAAAAAAEGAFRSCLNGMMPELLAYWDEQSRKNQISKRQWGERDEASRGGITFDDLQRTAAELENALPE
jgi:hypothetical protein